MTVGKGKPRTPFHSLKILWLLLLTLLVFLLVYSCPNRPQKVSLRIHSQARKDQKVLVSYSYYEKDRGQKENFAFFISAGMGVRGTGVQLPKATDFSLVVSGEWCTPCGALGFLVRERTPHHGGLTALWEGERLTVMHKANAGMDFGAHNVRNKETLEYIKITGKIKAYHFFIFLNSSVRGPFFPGYMPAQWRWPDAFIDRLDSEVKIVSSSLVCLPAIDAGGHGPKVESWAFAVDAAALTLLTEKGIFWKRSCKLCGNSTGIVVGSEYGMSKIILQAGYNLATLMSRYARNTDWRDSSNWACNDNVHPSRHGTYDGISMHPYETVFVKASWHVGEPYLSRYTRWAREIDAGRHGTAGSFQEDLYRFAISTEGQNPRSLADNLLLAKGA